MEQESGPNLGTSKKPHPWPDPESARQRGRGALTREELREKLPERPLLKPEDQREPQRGFPEQPEIEYERSVIRIPFYLKGGSGGQRRRGEQGKARREVDVMAFDAYMRLIREAPMTVRVLHRRLGADKHV